MQSQNMNLLNACSAVMGDTNMHIGVAQRMVHFAAAPTTETDDDHLALVCSLNGCQHVA